MDKYEYQVCADQIKTLIKERRFSEAMDIADTIDWRRVKSFSMLCTVSEIYKVTKHYSEARDILLLAYERYPDRANVVYALCELAIKLDDITESVEYYKEYVRLKPHDSSKYVLLYKIYEAQDVPLEEKISLLEEFKRADSSQPKWIYELALLYHKAGMETECVRECDELALWFGDGQYVHEALELKKQHAPLDREQQRKYDGLYDGPVINQDEKDATVHIYETQSMNAYANGASPYETAPIGDVQLSSIGGGNQANQQQAYAQQQQPYQGRMQPNAPYSDMEVQPPSTDKYSTISLQEELAKNMQEFYAREGGDIAAPYYGNTVQLYEPSQQQFINQINQAGQIDPSTGQIVYPYANQMQTTGQMGYTDPMQTTGQMGYTDPMQTTGQMGYADPMQTTGQTGYVDPMQTTGQMQYDPYQAYYGNQVPQTVEQGYDMQQTGQVQQAYYDNQYQQPQQYVQEPAYNQEPVYNSEPAYNPEPVYNPEPEYNPEPVYNQEPVQNTYNNVDSYQTSNTSMPPSAYDEPVEDNIPQAVLEQRVALQQEAVPVVETPSDNVTVANDNAQSNQSVAATPTPATSYVEPATMDKLPVYKESPASSATKHSEIKLPDYLKSGKSGVPKDMEDKLKEGLDGQMTLSLPDSKEIEKQITGQIDMGDYLKDWEKEWEEKKKSAEEQRKAQLKSRSLEQTSDIMAQLAGVIPGFEDVAKKEDVAEDKETKEEVKEDPVKSEEVLRDDEKGVVTKVTISSPSFDRDFGAKRTESGTKINGPLKSSITGEIPDFLPSSGDILPSGYRTTLEDEWGGNIAKIREEDENLVKRLTGELPEVEEVIPEEEEEQEPDYGEAEALEELEQPEVDIPEEVAEEESSEETEAQKTARVTGSIPPIDEANEKSDETIEERLLKAQGKLPDVKDEVKEDNKPSEIKIPSYISKDNDESDEEKSAFPYQVDAMGEVEELEVLEQPEELDDMLKTRPIPIDEIEAQQRYEAGYEDEYPEEEQDAVEEKPASKSPYVKKEIRQSRREFEDAEYDLFGRYDGIEPLKAQIVDVIDDMSMEAGRGNVIVMGSEVYGRKELALNIVRAVQIMDSSFSGKVAKISGEALNKKNIPVTLQKLKNGVLIVENAGGLAPVTVNSITDALLSSQESVLVVFEDEKSALEPLLNGCPDTKSVFDARIIIDDFSNDDLVAYAEGYAREMGYSIDELGILALHTRVAELETYDRLASLDEVIDIVDNAIRHVDRKNMSHFMDYLLAKRYDDYDYIVLREKDFIDRRN